MYQPFYPLTILDEAHRYDFVSVGEKTIAKTIVYQNATIVFSGSTPIRTRLYQIAIAREFKEASKRFFIQGFDGAKFEPFERNKSYEGFGISLRKN